METLEDQADGRQLTPDKPNRQSPIAQINLSDFPVNQGHRPKKQIDGLRQSHCSALISDWVRLF
jgi:hypothetical protein